MTTYSLAVVQGTSRGRDTYGYNIVSLRDLETGKVVARCMGGGYDMHGAVLGDWLTRTFPGRLETLAQQTRGQVDRWGNREPYGLRERKDGSVYLDGATGQRSMEIIAEAIGLNIREIRKGAKLTGYEVTESGGQR